MTNVCFLISASTRSLKLMKHSSSSDWNNDTSRGNLLDSDDCSLSSSTQSSSCHTAESSTQESTASPKKHLPECPSEPPSSLLKESDILSDDDGDYHAVPRQESPTKDIEVHLQRLRISDDLSVRTQQELSAGSEGDFETGEHPKLVRAHFCPIKRKMNSTKRQEILLTMNEHHQSLDSQSDTASMDLNSILEREFSIQSLTSVVNEDCFYEIVDHNSSS